MELVLNFTNRADQSRIILEVVQTRSPSETATSLGYFAFTIESPRKNHPLEVSFAYDEQGLVSVFARDPETGREAKRDFTSSPLPSERILYQKSLLDAVDLCE